PGEEKKMELVRSDALTPDGLRADAVHPEFTISAAAVLTPPAAARKHPTKAAARWMPADETLIPDSRAELTPAQTVERRLAVLLQGSAMPVSHVRLASRIGRKP